MRVFLAVLLLCAGTAAWSAGVYKWVDENGKVHYGSVRPKQAEAEQIQKGVCDTTDSVETCADKKAAAAARQATRAEQTQQRIDALQRYNEVSEAMQHGQVVTGMSPEQVYKTLGKPTHTNKYQDDEGTLLEEWSYYGGPVTTRVQFRDGAVSYVGATPVATPRQSSRAPAAENKGAEEEQKETRNERIERENSRGDIIDRYYKDNPPQYRYRR